MIKDLSSWPSSLEEKKKRTEERGCETVHSTADVCGLPTVRPKELIRVVQADR